MKSWKGIAALMLVAVLSSGCFLKSKSSKKVPPSVDPDSEKSHVADLTLHDPMRVAFENKGFYTPDICIQWVRYTKDGKVEGDFVEFANHPCIGELIDEDDVVEYKAIVKDQNLFGTYYIYDETRGFPALGLFREFNNVGSLEYRLEELCDMTSNPQYSNTCSVNMESSLFNTFIAIELGD